MDSKPLLAAVLLFFLVENVYMDCHPKLANPSTRAAFIECAREHLPQAMLDVVLDCVPENSDLETAINEKCKHGVHSPIVTPIDRCIEKNANERRAELEELDRNTDLTPLRTCVDNIPEPST